MFNFSSILSDLQAAIAVVASRERSLTALLVAVWGRIARMRTRLERLVAQWRAGTLPAPRAPRALVARPTRVQVGRQVYPSGVAWLRARVWAAGAFGSQLEHLLTDAECAAFLAEVPQARRILRPLFHMLGVNPVPEAVRWVRAPALVVAPRDTTRVDLGGLGRESGRCSIFRGMSGGVFLRRICYDIVIIGWICQAVCGVER